MNPVKVINKVLTVLVSVGAAFCVIFGLVMILWAFDRTPPFELISYTVMPVKAGQTTIVRAKVNRSVERRCEVKYSRMFFDSKGTHYALTDSVQFMNAMAVEAYNEISPNELKFTVVIPHAASQGTGVIMTPLNYECNPIHQFFPIEMVLNMNVEVLP